MDGQPEPLRTSDDFALPARPPVASRGWVLAFRTITRATDRRTSMFAILLASAMGDSAARLTFPDPSTTGPTGNATRSRSADVQPRLEGL